MEVAEIEKISPEDEVSTDVPCNDEAGNAASDIKLQLANIASIVKGRDLDSLHNIGGVMSQCSLQNSSPCSKKLLGVAHEIRQYVHHLPSHRISSAVPWLRDQGGGHEDWLV